ncbi:thioredoxin fold domain-containing protein [Pseudoduganella eburnea]|jgi:thiol:disulfide interchange protein DsbC|uniref:Thiol:disulfide interchange protein n=1 Tax=Massilia eburnea TaxID=1776165 RepID=A0A6L6QNY7_9BURK|nr:DsbC family protein [Massilia eburnea]MTW13607.1 thioredoxin fold domain-containing protein [Massilia eburnea]
MKMSKLVLAMASVMLMSCADAQNAKEEAQLRKVLTERLGGVKIDSIIKTQYADLYEIRVGSEIRYTDKTGSIMVAGHIFDLKTSQDLTQARIDDLNKIKFDDLPKELAMKTVKGNGKRVMAIFEDPNCGYCKRFRQNTLANVDNVTVYTFLYNILTPESATKSQNIWCSADRNKAWDDWMLNGKAPAPAPAGCTSPNDKVLALGQKININGTPAIFFADGSRIAGAVDQRTLEAKFATIK